MGVENEVDSPVSSRPRCLQCKRPHSTCLCLFLPKQPLFSIRSPSTTTVHTLFYVFRHHREEKHARLNTVNILTLLLPSYNSVTDFSSTPYSISVECAKNVNLSSLSWKSTVERCTDLSSPTAPPAIFTLFPTKHSTTITHRQFAHENTLATGDARPLSHSPSSESAVEANSTLFPSSDQTETRTNETVSKSSLLFRIIIIPDGSWRTCKRMMSAVAKSNLYPCVKILHPRFTLAFIESIDSTRNLQCIYDMIRKEPRLADDAIICMSTCECVCEIIAECEDSREVYLAMVKPLMALVGIQLNFMNGVGRSTERDRFSADVYSHGREWSRLCLQ